MPIQIDGKTPDTIRVGRDDGSLATIGEARVWDGQWRTVYTSWKPRIAMAFGSGNEYGWFDDQVGGDTSLITPDRHLRFWAMVTVAPVTVDRVTRTGTDINSGLQETPAFQVIPAGLYVRPLAGTPEGEVYTFTEVRA